MSKHNKKNWFDNKNWWDENSKAKNSKEKLKQVVGLRKEAIERFTEMLRIRALYDNVYTNVVYDARKQRLDIYSYYDNVCAHSEVGVNYIVSNMFRIGDVVYESYECIKEIFICSFETPAGVSKLLFHGRGRKGKRQLPFPAASLLCEKGISERPQTLRNSETINNPSLNYAQSNAERILNRSPAGEPAFHCFLHSAQTFLQSLCNDVPIGAQCVL